MNTPISFVKLNSKAKQPIRGSRSAAGFDLYSAEHCVIKAGERALVNTGLSFVMPLGTYARIAARSSYAVRGIDVGAGVIDPDYAGQVKVLMINNAEKDFVVEEGERFAQVIFEHYFTGEMTEITSFDPPSNNPFDEQVIKVYKITPDTRLPEKHCADKVVFYFNAQTSFLLQPKSRKLIQTGLRFKFSPKIYGYVSGQLDLATQGLDCLEGHIDPEGDEAKIILVNTSHVPMFIEKGEKIAKLIFVRNAAYPDDSVYENFKAAHSGRGEKGFGSTGNR